MKLKSNPFLRSALLTAATLGMITFAQATLYYWDNTSPIETSGFGTAGGTWGTEAKWSTSSTGVVTPGIIAPTTSDDLYFGTDTATYGLASGIVNVSGTVNAKSLTFGSQSGGITLSGGTAINLAATSTITVNNASDTISTTITGATTLNKAGSGTLILGHATNTLPDAVALNISAGKIDFGANTDTIGIVGMTGGQIGGTSGTLAVTRLNVDSTTTAEMTGGNINSGSATARGLAVGSNTTATFTISGGTFTSNSPNSNPSSGNVTSFIGNGSGNGTLVIDGGAYVGNGILKLGYFASGSGTLTIKSGSANIKTLIYDANNTSGSAIVNLNGGTLTVSDIGITSGATKQFNFGGGTLATATGVDLPSTKFTGLTMTVNGGGAKIDTLDRTITINQALQAGTGSGGLTKSGSGTLSLGGANAYTGATTLSNGTLSVATIGNGGVAGNLGQASNAATNIVFDGGTLKYTGNTATSDRAFTINTGKTATIEVSTSGQSLSLVGATGTATTGALTKTGAGTLTLTGANTYTGTTTLSNGTLSVATIGDGGVAGNLGQASNAATNIVFDGGTLKYTGNTATSDRAFTINAGKTATIEVSTTGQSLSLVGATGTATTGALTKTGAGTLVLTGASTYTGATSISGGGILSVSSLPTTGDTSSNLGLTSAIQIGGASSSGTLLYTGAAKTTDRGISMSGGTQGSNVILDQSGTGLLKFTGNFTNVNSAITKTLTLQGSTAGTGEISGSIQEGTGGMVTSLTKAGTGTWTLSGANSYTGTTTVSDGKLVVNGNISTSSLTSVGSNGTLGGTGTLGATTVNGIFAPGNSIGTINVNGTLALAGTANFEIDPTVGLGLNRSSDLANVSGAVTYGGILNLLYGGLSSDFTNGMVFNLFDATSFSGSFSALNLPTLTGTLSWQDNLATNGTLTVVPEPNVAALLGGFGTLLLLRRRRA